MPDIPPRVYLLHGDDEFAMTEFIQGLKSRLGDSTTAEMNFQQFQAADLDWPGFEAAASSLPFLSPRRLVVLDQAERLQKDESSRQRLMSLLENIPESTALLLLEHSAPQRSTKPRIKSALQKWAEDNPDLSLIHPCVTKQGSGFVQWLKDRASSQDGSIEHDAAILLAEWTQEDPRLASQELRKLLDYVDLQRAIQVEDVEQCTPYRGQSNIFALVDAIGQRRGEDAQKKLHEILQEVDVKKIFAMIIRQFRLILLARAMIDSARVPDQSIHRSDFVVKKAANQARNFSMDDLDRIYHELLEIDRRSKNGQMDLDVALDRFISAVTA